MRIAILILTLLALSWACPAFADGPSPASLNQKPPLLKTFSDMDLLKVEMLDKARIHEHTYETGYSTGRAHFGFYCINGYLFTGPLDNQGSPLSLTQFMKTHPCGWETVPMRCDELKKIHK